MKGTREDIPDKRQLAAHEIAESILLAHRVELRYNSYSSVGSLIGAHPRSAPA
jgi:hypothetical protein